MLKAEQISKIYPSNGIKALDNFSLDINTGEIMGLLGPNGAGKSTFVRIAVGILDRDSGSIRIDGYDPEENRKKIAQMITWIPQEGASRMILHKTGRDNIIYYSLIRGISKKETNQRIDDLLEQLNLDKRIVNRYYRLMSGGQKQLINILNGLVMDADLLFCDEISVSIDPIIAKAVYNYLQELVDEGKSVLLTSQNITEVEYLSDRIAIIHQGKLVEVDKPRIISKKILKKEILDLHFDIDVDRSKTFLAFEEEFKGITGFDEYSIVGNTLRFRTDNANRLLKLILPLLEQFKLTPSIESGKANLAAAIQNLVWEEES